MLTLNILTDKAQKHGIDSNTIAILSSVFTLTNMVSMKAICVKDAQSHAAETLENFTPFELEAAFSYIVDSQDESSGVGDRDTYNTLLVMGDIIGPLF